MIGEVTWWGTPSGGLVSMELFDVDILESERSAGYSRLVLRMSQSDTEELGLLLSKSQTVSMVNELENLRMTTAEDKRHMDRQAVEISRLTDDRNHWQDVAAMREQNARELAASGTALTVEQFDALRATIVRQATEITELKGESE